MKQYMIKEEMDLRLAIDKFWKEEEGFSEDVIEIRINKFRMFLDTSKRVVKANNFKIRNLKDTSKFRDIWVRYNYYSDRDILKFYDKMTKRYTSELQNNEIQRLTVSNDKSNAIRI